MDPAPQEFPRIDERWFGQPHRLAWSMATSGAANARFTGATALYAHDLTTDARSVHDFGPACHPGEFVFVPETAEGHGWLIGLVIDAGQDTTDLIILDARHFEDAPVASVRLPHRAPPGFHGNWITAGTPK